MPSMEDAWDPTVGPQAMSLRYSATSEPDCH